MATLHVRGVPDDLYEGLRKYAEMHGSSISAAAILLLRKALVRETELEARRALVEEILSDPIHWPDDAPSPAELIREDRDG